MATVLNYNINSRNNQQIIAYGVITSIPTLAKKSVTLSGEISGRGPTKSIADVKLYYKINGGAEELLCSAYSGESSVSVDATGTFSLPINLTSVTKLSFRFDGRFSSGKTGTFNADINLSLGNTVSTETKVTADWVNKVSELVEAGTSATAGEEIKRGRYSAIATAAGASAPDGAFPLASDLTAIVNKINSTTYSRDWDSTSSSDY